MNDEPDEEAYAERALQLLEQSRTALEDVLHGFDLMAKRIRAGEELSQAELSRALIALGQTRMKLIDEVKQHDHRVLLAEGRIADAPLDLEAIRIAIGSHIDRISTTLDEEKFH